MKTLILSTILQIFLLLLSQTGFAPPYGTEIYKVFATPKPINLTSIITKQNSSTKGSLSDIEKVIMGTYGNTKSDETDVIKK